MGKKRTYESVDIKALDVPRLLAVVTAAAVVSIDVAKAAFVAMIGLVSGETLRIVRFEHPTETRMFLSLVAELKARIGVVRVLMEPTGTYGDALRYRLGELGVEIRMLQPKRTHDAKEAFDGVPAKLDPKDTVVMAKLDREGASTPWIATTDERRDLRAIFDGYLMRDARREALFSQIEARLARHWPELEEWLSVRDHVSARVLLERLTSPANVANDPAEARALLRRASRGALSQEAIDGVVESAKTSLGVPMREEEATLLRDLIRQLRVEVDACEEMEERLAERAKGNRLIARMRDVVGIMAATAIVTFLGSPADFPGARAILKAAGLNMREWSSGTRQSNVHITKRGPSIVRQLLFMAAMRAAGKDMVARAWYRGRNCYRPKDRTGALVALMRKLLAGAYYVGKHDVAYDSSKLFDTRRLALTPVTERESSAPKRRTKPRSIARGRRRSRHAHAGGGPA